MIYTVITARGSHIIIHYVPIIRVQIIHCCTHIIVRTNFISTNFRALDRKKLSLREKQKIAPMPNGTSSNQWSEKQ